MAPSRGVNFLFRARFSASPSNVRRYSEFVRAATDPSRKSQIYISRSRNPYLNLSIEQYLLQNAPEDATVLFLYTNRPCIVIGRNQNPWVEVNLDLLRNGPLAVELVRRRSGGGTVFHDEGNVNYGVICPTQSFNRDKHAEMVVRALHSLGVSTAAVNERHDIVLDDHGGSKPLKVSGSAYKLTRLRSLHHGTCLLSSPNLNLIGRFLRSPAKPFIKARGVDSVGSPITNVHVSNTAFEQSVMQEFGKLYGLREPTVITDSLLEVPEIRRGFEELRSLDWIYSQTPQFTFSTHATEEDPRERSVPGGDLQSFRASFTARNGTITHAEFKSEDTPGENDQGVNNALVNKKLHEIETWTSILPSDPAGRFMNELFRTGGNPAGN